MSIDVYGVQKLTLLDYPGHTACTLFTGGCNFRCPFCHNASLVLSLCREKIPQKKILDFLRKRIGLLDGVCISGGEPTIQKELPDFAREIKDLGFLVKLDTNGTNPLMLHRLISDGLVDYVAMDIKSSLERYPVLTGRLDVDIESIKESVEILFSQGIDFEFRTTVVRELHSEADFVSIGEWLQGDERYYLQGFQDSGNIIRLGLTACNREDIERYREVLSIYIPKVEIRGI